MSTFSSAASSKAPEAVAKKVRMQVERVLFQYESNANLAGHALRERLVARLNACRHVVSDNGATHTDEATTHSLFAPVRRHSVHALSQSVGGEVVSLFRFLHSTTADRLLSFSYRSLCDCWRCYGVHYCRRLCILHDGAQ